MNNMKVLKEQGNYRIVRIDDLCFYPTTNQDDCAGYIPQTKIEVQQHIRIACVGMWIVIKRWVYNGDNVEDINYNIELAKELFDKIVE